MAVPNIIADAGGGGSTVTQITQDGPGWFTLPFQDAMDSQTWEWHAWFTQYASSYVAFTNPRLFATGFVPYVEQMQQISTARGIGYLVHEEEPSEINNTGWLRFKRTYAGFPLTRYEGTQVPYSFQLRSTTADYTWATPPPGNEVAEFTYPLSGWRKFEYFTGAYPSIIVAPRVTAINGNFLYVPFQSVTSDDGGFPPTYTVPWVARDSEIRIYKGAFIERMTIYVQGPKPIKV